MVSVLTSCVVSQSCLYLPTWQSSMIQELKISWCVFYIQFFNELPGKRIIANPDKNIYMSLYRIFLFSSLLSVDEVTGIRSRTLNTADEEYQNQDLSTAIIYLLPSFCSAAHPTGLKSTKLCLLCIRHRLHAVVKSSRTKWTTNAIRAECFSDKSVWSKYIVTNTANNFWKASLSSFQNICREPLQKNFLSSPTLQNSEIFCFRRIPKSFFRVCRQLNVCRASTRLYLTLEYLYHVFPETNDTVNAVVFQ